MVDASVAKQLEAQLEPQMEAIIGANLPSSP